MSSTASVRSEQSKQPLVNLASLPRDEALDRAHAAGRGILLDSDAVSEVLLSLWTGWMNENIPNACSQSEEEFGQLLDSMMRQFEAGVREFVASASDRASLERFGKVLEQKSRATWKVHNVVAFMVEALPDDAAGALPTRCTLVDVRDEMEQLAMSLRDLADAAERSRHE
ncbi:hypothetical protein CUJ91_04665 [Paraburkholderia graminis]|uniref:hypothetical protein n=1 Tax=Paraburkholderia graminis TaxID=60548 RepID=UPI000DEFA57E|nr:hypothetical protein [Paraburkholderia graminis]AXF07289.1 hypothetical protein CUJ91_04665 [Paraburkholderia graminis]